MRCRSCKSKRLTSVLDLGNQYLSDFREDPSRPPKYPLEAVICEDCMLVQLTKDTPQPEMYHDNYGFKSSISNSIKDDLKDVVQNGLKYCPKGSNWLDIASNDGTLLGFVPKSFLNRVGVDPVTKYCKEAKQYASIVINDYFHSEVDDQGRYYLTTDDKTTNGIRFHGIISAQYDVITSISVFYDMPDPNRFVEDVKNVLAEKGIWIIQQNYLLPTIQYGAVDNFCHEHLEYYTLLSLEPLLERHGLEVIDVSTSEVNGGSIRTYVAHKGQYPVQDSVEQQRTIEQDAGLHDIQTYKDFAQNALKNIQDLRGLVLSLKLEEKRIVILAASTRGATIWQCAGLGPDQIDYAVERNPEKVGKWFSAIKVPIMSEEHFRDDHPDYAIIGPWFFADEIIDREKEFQGKFIKPLPKLEVI